MSEPILRRIGFLPICRTWPLRFRPNPSLSI
jgi:hypothetical protein